MHTKGYKKKAIILILKDIPPDTMMFLEKKNFYDEVDISSWHITIIVRIPNS